jgi:hypothetical protein
MARLKTATVFWIDSSVAKDLALHERRAEGGGVFRFVSKEG